MAVITVNPFTSIDKIQEYLKKSGNTIKFKGTFNLTKLLYLYSNTIIDLSEAVLIRKHPKYVFFTYCNSSTTKYNGQHDIQIIGGKIIGNGYKGVSNIISLAHAKNIAIKGLTIENNVGSHAIEINGCNNVTIEKCIFDKNIIAKGGEFRECIQIDFANYQALTYSSNKNAKCYDDTHCSNIIIKNNICKGFNIFAGTHTQTASKNKHKNIQIIGNTCVGIGAVEGYGSCIKIMNMENVMIENNTISKFARGIEICSSNRFYQTNGNTITTKPSHVTGNNKIIIRNNQISDPSKEYKASGIYIHSKFDGLVHDDILIEKNAFKLKNGVSKYAIRCDGNCATNLVERNNKSDI